MFRKISDSKSRTSAIEGQTSAIEEQTSAIQQKKLSMEVLESAIQETNYKEPIPTNLILVYEAIEMNRVFGASEVVNILRCSSTTREELELNPQTFIEKLKKDM